MGVNQSEAVPDESRHTRFGKNYWDIDFYPSEQLTMKEYADGFIKGNTRPVVGLLQVGKNRVPVTISELERIYDTIADAINTINHSYKLGYLI